MTRRDWWIGVAVLAAALLFHAVWPRYEVRWPPSPPIRIDRWTGNVAYVQPDRPTSSPYDSIEWEWYFEPRDPWVWIAVGLGLAGIVQWRRRRAKGVA